ncbi:MAG TPA: hypothetical protein VKE51_23955 [Vicinamibacterales bacterium]|nr:hypothetical protein [Vicinamibacterales bacterium]
MHDPDSREAALESFLIGPRRADNGPRCAVVTATRVLPFDLGGLAKTAAGAGSGDIVAYAIALEGGLMVRLLMLLTLGIRVARARRILRGAGAARVHRFAVLPTLDRPTIAYEIGTAAAQYADRHLRPRGAGGPLRTIIASIAGVDPSIGAVVVAGLMS